MLYFYTVFSGQHSDIQGNSIILDSIHFDSANFKKNTENSYPHVFEAIKRRHKTRRPMSEFEDIAKKANEIILESISEGVFTVDHNWRIMTFSRTLHVRKTTRADTAAVL